MVILKEIILNHKYQHVLQINIYQIILVLNVQLSILNVYSVTTVEVVHNVYQAIKK